MEEDFKALMAEVLPGNVAPYYDVESIDKACKSLDERVQRAAHCAIFSRTEEKYSGVPIKALVMVSFNLLFIAQFIGGYFCNIFNNKFNFI